MIQGPTIQYYFKLAVERNTVRRAIRVAILVGIILNLINHPEVFLSFNFSDLDAGPVLLTFLVPYLVSTYSSVLSGSSLKPGKVSQIDALLKCNSCKKSDFSVNVGQAIEPCPTCKQRTRWRIAKLFSFVSSGNEVLKSLALFARHNPQPLFRLDEEGIIIGANPASEEMFGLHHISGKKLKEFVPEVEGVNLKNLIEQESVEHLVVQKGDHYFKFVMKGVIAIQTVHVYGSDITEIVLAEQKIRSQAKEINSSIQYAWRIQKSLLPGSAFMSAIFPVNFVFNRPRNVVSGDFYWVNRIGDIKILAVADCTGHGVPGAFMSMLGITLLNEIVLREGITSPDLILNELRSRLVQSLSVQQDESSGLSDGMDIAVVAIDMGKNEMTFAGAFNPMLLCRDGKLLVHEADRMPVGKYYGEMKPFSLKRDIVQPGDRIFLFSDGYQDQFGGENNKKFTRRGLKELLVRTDPYTFEEIHKSIIAEFETWKSNNDQVDDVLVVGVEFG
jgi:serine phosphatase RsbU (regulator of sigma subunit)/PAS domain-containing protein